MMKIRLLLLIAGIMISSHSFPQSAGDFRKLSCPEKVWAVLHPFTAKKCWQLTKVARQASQELMHDTLFDGLNSGGQVDAFRHAYWMALVSRKYSARKARSLGRAHEKGNYRQFLKKQIDEEVARPDSISTLMDLLNNEKGISIGIKYAEASEDSLREIIKAEILDGQLFILARSPDGAWIDCKGNKVDTTFFTGKWHVPKCLVPSDKVHFQLN